MQKKTNKAPTIEDKINEIKKVIILNHPDGFNTEEQLNELLRLQQAKCEMNKEIDIKVSDVIKEYPIGEAVVVKRIKQGWLFECRNGFMTFVPHNVSSVSGMLADVATLIENGKDKGGDEGEFIAAVSYVFQAPIFSSLSIPILFDNATQILKGFNSYCEEHYSEEKEHETTEQEYKDTSEQDNINQALEYLE